MNNNINELIGLPWGYREGCVDCAKLAVMAQKIIRNISIPYPWQYETEAELLTLSRTILLPEVRKICVPVRKPGLGVWGVMQFEGEMAHLVTFISEYEFLHIPRNNTSRITRLSKPYQKKLVGLYWIDRK